ncbi:MAG: hypothetical protein JWQ81_4275 [Amycolatopsis sp.]|jgi:hypothetical protein|uniref:DUF397 domain-containing protein n=1 Tax=Amycolatopsis sp. TaxID=37632 RepID=UPI00261E0B39|nr:DUF397 domain-containing protein [Amycolatopsis sp.]MCU1683536.1 hypothetical protein [Amycolatopsis sp.]
MNTNHAWRKSSYSNSQSACVELAVGHDGGGVRDTKNREGGALRFDRAAFGAFLDEVKGRQAR